MIRGVPTGDLGLDVLLGGGWRLIKRFEDKESATVIVRGGSGAGKTLVGIQAAIALASASLKRGSRNQTFMVRTVR